MSSSERSIEFRGQSDEDPRFYSLTLREGTIERDGDVVYPHDRITADGLHATGVVVNATDTYRFTGEVEHIYVDEDIVVALDGAVVEPGSLVESDAPDSPDQQTIPEMVAEQVESVTYDGEYLDVDGVVRFHWETAWNVLVGGG